MTLSNIALPIRDLKNLTKWWNKYDMVMLHVFSILYRTLSRPEIKFLSRIADYRTIPTSELSWKPARTYTLRHAHIADPQLLKQLTQANSTAMPWTASY